MLNVLDQPLSLGSQGDLQPEVGQCLDHGAVEETVVRLNDERYRLSAAVDFGTDELLHTALEPTTTTGLAQSF